jgi:tetratricopeptide (TPR) repeat protein
MASPPQDRHATVSGYFAAGLEMEPGERERWLRELSARDPEIGADVAALLEEHEAVSREQFLENAAALLVAPTLAGQAVGAYTIVAPIGRGGMGTVWLAARSDGRFERKAAVKFLNVALFGGGDERFTREGMILARLTHPHIAQLLDAGVSPAAQPYLVLEYVDGQPIDQYCDARGLDVDARVRLFLDVLDAVAYAHANLIVHRDLKPSNVFVDEGGRVKLLDFGIAKLLEREGDSGAPTPLTREAGSALTPEYASPEQITGKPVTTATDVYALGVLLYTLLARRHPAGDSLHSTVDLIEAIVNTEPPPMSAVAPAAISRQLRGDLDTIVSKAVKKPAAERYQSVTALAADLERYLRHEPIAARPDTFAYLAAKFVRRNRTVVGLALLAMVATTAGVVGTLLQARTAQAQRDFAIRQLRRAEAINELNAFVLSDAAPSGKPFTVNDLLANAEQIAARQPDRSDPSRVDMLISIGRQYATQDEGKSALRVLTEAYDQSRSIADPSIRARASCSLGTTLVRGRESARGEALVEEGLRELGSDRQLLLDRIFCLERSSEIARDLSRPAVAIERALEALRLVNDLPFPSQLTEYRAEENLAESYREAGRFPEAIAGFERASTLLTALGREQTQVAGTLFNNWALAVSSSGHILEAATVFRRAIDLSRDNRFEQAVSPMLLNNYARVLNDLARYDEAADYAERAYAKAVEADEEIVINQSLLLRADIYAARGESARAMSMIDEVEPRLHRALPAGHFAFGAIPRGRALAAAARGDFQAALDQMNRAIAIFEEAARTGGGGAEVIPSLLGRRAELERRLGRPDAAAAAAGQALALARQHILPGGRSFLVGRLQLALGRALAALGKTGDAHAAFVAALQNLDGTVGTDHPDAKAARELAGGPASR